ncbi:hypothetical protein BB560_004207 [Smittium megazygosporum]|uniref:Uncharacterized protein n=1 Tax=Smittium megazygosporum TaxID=133381 RepID=A0A2T9Z9Y8_9FUNG|nr:hypothetical protein BB560_004207 [Smittium megazygosporum]
MGRLPNPLQQGVPGGHAGILQAGLEGGMHNNPNQFQSMIQQQQHNNMMGLGSFHNGGLSTIPMGMPGTIQGGGFSQVLARNQILMGGMMPNPNPGSIQSAALAQQQIMAHQQAQGRQNIIPQQFSGMAGVRPELLDQIGVGILGNAMGAGGLGNAHNISHVNMQGQVMNNPHLIQVPPGPHVPPGNIVSSGISDDVTTSISN